MSRLEHAVAAIGNETRRRAIEHDAVQARFVFAAVVALLAMLALPVLPW